MNDTDARALLSRWITAGDLVFDVGAHEGKHTRVLADMGARVVAFEPQPGKRQEIDGVQWVEAAVSDEDGKSYLLIDSEHDYLSTLATDYPERVRQHSSDYFARKGRQTIPVLTYTLDTLIGRFGMPAFAKIDVEGHELAVLAGLSQPLPALSFEVHDFGLDKAQDCIDMLDALGRYTYLYSRRELFQPEDIGGLFADPEIFGDVYAIRAD